MMPTLYERLYLLPLKDNATEKYTKKYGAANLTKRGLLRHIYFILSKCPLLPPPHWCRAGCRALC